MNSVISTIGQMMMDRYVVENLKCMCISIHGMTYIMNITIRIFVHLHYEDLTSDHKIDETIIIIVGI